MFCLKYLNLFNFQTKSLHVELFRREELRLKMLTSPEASFPGVFMWVQRTNGGLNARYVQLTLQISLLPRTVFWYAYSSKELNNFNYLFSLFL